MALKKGSEVATIDVVLVTITTMGLNPTEIGLTTANKINVEPATETTDAVKNIVKGVLIAQKPAQTILTGNTITLTDNVFNAELVKILQGGVILYWADAEHTTTSDTDMGHGVARYTPPVVGAKAENEIFILNAYSAIYNAAGIITGYEKISYPNCKGQPTAFSTEDGTFRAPEYTINSAPDTGEAPYDLSYVDELPSFELYTITQNLTHVLSSNVSTEINKGEAFSTTLTAVQGYDLDTPTVTMGGIDVTATVFDSATGKVTIPRVIGNIVITATATEQ